MDFARTQARLDALKLALDMHRSAGDLFLTVGVDQATTIANDEAAVLSTADRFWAWTQGTTRLLLIAGPVIDQITGHTSEPTGDPDMSQITDSQNSSLTVRTVDAKGFGTPDHVDWAFTPDDDSVVTAAVSEDGKTFAYSGVAPGTVNGTVTDNSVDPPLSASFVIDVVPAGTATIQITDGPVTEQ